MFQTEILQVKVAMQQSVGGRFGQGTIDMLRFFAPFTNRLPKPENSSTL